MKHIFVFLLAVNWFGIHFLNFQKLAWYLKDLLYKILFCFSLVSL